MAKLDVVIDPRKARAGAAIAVAALNQVTEAAGTASLAGLNVGKSFGLALGGIQAALAVFGGPLSAVTYGLGLLVGQLAISAAVDDWRNLGAAIGDLRAITGAAGANLSFLTTTARDFGAASVFSAQQAARSFTLVASARPALLDDFEGLADVSADVLILAQAAGIDLAQAAVVAGQAMNQFSLEANESGRVINVLAAGAKFGSSEIASTADAIRRAGVVAASANVSFEEMNAAIQLLAAGGIVGRRAGSSLKNVILGLQLATEAFNPSLHGLEGALRNVADAGLSMSEQLRLVGREGITALKILTDSGDAFADLTQKITGTNTALEQSEQRYDNLEGDNLRLDSSLESLSQTVGTYFVDAERFYVRLKGAVVDTINDLIRLDNAFLRSSSRQAEQNIGPIPEGEVGVFAEIAQALDVAGQQIGTSFGNLGQSIDEANLEAEELTVTAVNYWNLNVARLRAYLAERRGEHQLAAQITEEAEQQAEHRERILAQQQQILRVQQLQRELESQGLTLVNANLDAPTERARELLAAERARNELLEERREAVARGLDPLSDIQTAGLDDQVDLARGYLEGLRTEAEQLEIDLQRIQALGNLGVFAPDPEENSRVTEQVLAATEQAYQDHLDEIERRRLEAEQRERERIEREEQRRQEAAARELQRQQDLADTLTSRYAPLIGLQQARTQAIEDTNASLQRGLLTEQQHEQVLQGINEQYLEEQARVTGATEALEARRAVIQRFFPQDAALQEYLDTIRMIDEANLGAADSELAKAQAAQEYNKAITQSDTVTQRVIQRYLPARSALEEYMSALEDIGEANLNSVETEMAKVEALNQYSRAIARTTSDLDTVSSATSAALGLLREQWEDFAEDASETIAGALVGIEQDFDAFSRRVIQRLIAAQLEARVFNPLLGAAESFLGGLLQPGFSYSYTSTGGVGPSLGGGGLQFGGQTRPGRSYLVGEAGPEIFTQGRAGGVVTPLGNRGGDGSSVFVNVYTDGNSQVQTEDNTDENGDRTIDVMVSSSLNRMGRAGELDGLFRNYGTSRQLISR